MFGFGHLVGVRRRHVVPPRGMLASRRYSAAAVMGCDRARSPAVEATTLCLGVPPRPGIDNHQRGPGAQCSGERRIGAVGQVMALPC